MMTTPEPIFVDLSLASELEDPAVTEIESLCLTCHGKGITRLLLTKIPHYKEVIITSFECNDCGDKNNGIQTGSIQEHGTKYELKVEKIEDLSRQIVKSDYATLIIPDLDFEIPADRERGEITTVEGIVLKTIDGLSQGQESRKIMNIELFEQIQNFIIKLKNLFCSSFTLIIDDPSGNSFVENLLAPKTDPHLIHTMYQRTKAQNQSLGFQETNEDKNVPEKERKLNTVPEDGPNLKEEVLQFNTICDECSRPSVTKMKVTDIPHFKEVVIMASECDSCGHKTNEVKSGGGIETKGKKYTLHIKNREDIARDVLKSETCSIIVQELELNVGAGIFVGKFTTVEGLLNDIKDDLLKNRFLLGDSTTEEKKNRMEKLIQNIQEVIDGKADVHLILDDPAGNSFVQDLYVPDKDPFLVVEEYERSFEQNEELGLNDMKTENYVENN